MKHTKYVLINCMLLLRPPDINRLLIAKFSGSQKLYIYLQLCGRSEPPPLCC